MIKKAIILILMTFSFGKGNDINAQSIELGGSLNYLSNGFQLTYQKPFGKKWELGGGLRSMVNMYSVNKNEQNYSYYQNGYASTLWEHFGLVGNARFRLLKIWKFTLNAQGNMLLTWHGLKAKTTALNITTGQRETHITYKKPSPALETTIGFSLKGAITKRIGAVAAIGYGIMLSYHSHEGINLVTGNPVTTHSFDVPWERGIYEFVGLDGHPMIYFGLSYSLGK